PSCGAVRGCPAPVLSPLLSCCAYRSRALRELPSFPTRRSSDLEVIGVRLSGGPRALHDPADRSTAAPLRHRVHPGAAPLWSGQPDRKSTRLNSSHVSISYAVFCLKKKTHTHNRSEGV